MNNLRYRRPRPGRRRELQQQTTTTHHVIKNVCKSSPTLEPGHSLARGEFFCHGDLRFGIDAALGQFMVGFVHSSSSSNTGNNATVGGKFDNNGTTATAFDPTVDHALPAIQAWTAIPTTLSTLFSSQQSFAYLTLTHDGNLLGYSNTGTEIYDSNYDYHNRLTGKKADSILGFSSKCLTQSDMIASSVGGSEMCVTLTSPARAGMPYGMVTWGIVVDPVNFLDMPSQSQSQQTVIAKSTPAPVASLVVAPTNEPTSRPTRRPRPTTPNLSFIGGTGVRTPSASPTPSPIDYGNNNMFADDSLDSSSDSQESIISSIESTSIIWGTVWLDSNRNGAIDLGEDTVNDFEVKLHECSDNSARADNRPDGNDESDELTVTTDGEGMYFFQVPAGRTYRIKFDIHNNAPNFHSTANTAARDDNNAQNNINGYGYSHGQHTHTNMLGWTDCMTSSMAEPIQWNAGLYLVNDVAFLESVSGDDLLLAGEGSGNSDDANKEMTQLPSAPAEELNPEQQPIKASIGGHIYLDTDENGDMGSTERTAAVGGYTVNDAVVAVTLTDCKTNLVLQSMDVHFPGTYSFGNLTEGLYKLGYEMQLKAGSAAVAKDALPYSFVDAVVGAGGEGDFAQSYYETGCGKLGEGEVIDKANVGLRPLLDVTMYSADGSLGPQALSAEMQGADAENGNERDMASVRAAAPEDEGKEGSNTLVPALVGVFVTLSIVAFAAVAFVKYRNDGSVGALPFLGGGSKTVAERERDVRSVGSSEAGDDLSIVSDTSSNEGQQTAIGSLVVEAGDKSVAALTNMEGDDDESDSDSDSSSDDGSESSSYTGMEFSLKQETPNNQGSIGGGSPYQSSFSPSSDNNSSSHVRDVEKEEGSEDCEVYDDEEDEEQGGDASNTADYGPVISDMIAKYSQKQAGSSGSDEEQQQHGPRGVTQGVQQGSPGKHQDNAQNYSDPQGPQAPAYPPQQEHSQNYTQHQDQHGNYIGHQASNYPPQDHSQNYHGTAYQQYQTAEQQQLAIVPSGGEDSQDYQYDNSAGYNQAGYYGNNDATAYDHHQAHHQYQQNAHEYGEEQYDEMSTSESSARSADPPAASYKDIPAANAGWDGSAAHHPQEYHHHPHHQQQYDASQQYDQQYDAPQQYGGPSDGGAYDGANYEGANYEGYDANQYAAENDGAYSAAAYDPNHYGAANDDSGAYAAHHDTYDEQHPPMDSESSSSSSESEDDYDDDDDDDDNYHHNLGNGDDDDENYHHNLGNDNVTSSSSTTGANSISNWSNNGPTFSGGSSKSHRAAARRAQSNPRDDRNVGSWRQQAAIPENSALEDHAYLVSNENQASSAHGVAGEADYDDYDGGLQAQVGADDNKSVISSGSDQSSDPPGTSYKNLHRQFPPPPPPRRTSPNNVVRGASPNVRANNGSTVSPNRSPGIRRVSPPKPASSVRRGRSVPPPPPPRGFPSPPPR